MFGILVLRIRDFINKLSKVILRNEFVRKILVSSFYYIKHKIRFLFVKQSCDKMKSLMDAQITLSLKPSCCFQLYRANMFYGIASAISSFAGYKKPIKACMEHGVYFGDYTNALELDSSGFPCLYTFSSTRAEHIRSVSDVPIVTLGPYISYADNFLSENELHHLKQHLGRTLLVFPTHSTDEVDAKYSVSGFIDEIDTVAIEKNIDTVLVCLYYKDVNPYFTDLYEREGYKTVCAGIREDQQFLSRLRSLIQLSDYTMSNSVGTHVGYCAFFDKPHYIFSQKSELSTYIDSKEFSETFVSSRAFEKDEVLSVFNIKSDTVTILQKEICTKYWGFDQIKDRKSLSIVLNKCEEAFHVKSSERQNKLREIVKSLPENEQELFKVE